MDYHTRLPKEGKMWSPMFCLLFLGVLAPTSAVITKVDMPREIQQCYNGYSTLSLTDAVGQSVCWSCESPAIMSMQSVTRPPISTPSARAYLERLLRKVEDIAQNGHNSYYFKKCERREYRTLSDQDRNRFHRTLNFLKEDKTVEPNKYDAIARFHSGYTIQLAHGGPNFLGWHRIYLLVLEFALQEVDSYVCLPYWDSSLDSELDDPASSYVFSKDFFGGGRFNRTVSDGPFAHWVTPDHGPLIRNIGASGQLFNLSSIINILSQSRTRDISPPTAAPKNGLEFNHNGIHVFIGGQMDDLRSAAHDPIFFLHHVFVDYLWEAFRSKQRDLGIDPEVDYPKDFGSPLHSPYREVGLHLLKITSIQAYDRKLKLTYDYTQTPTCNEVSGCGSKYLGCNPNTGRCIPVNPYAKATRNCPKSRIPFGIQNTYCIDGECDMRGWVYVPVKVISKRSPDLKMYGSFPVYNGSVFHSSDIYQPSAYSETSNILTHKPPMSYNKCDSGKGIGQIYIQSNGINYNGFYKESVIIDQRLATSIAVGYLAVKDPGNGPVRAMLRAFDSCGRICNTAFRTSGSRRFDPFSGLVQLENVPGQPKHYSYTYGQATLDTWGYSSNRNCPKFIDEEIYVSFYCDYNNKLPWVRTQKDQPQPQPQPQPQIQSQIEGQKQIQQAVSELSRSSAQLFECQLSNDCTIDVSCVIANGLCTDQTYSCRNSCNRFVQCEDGQLVQKTCPYDWSFDVQQGACTAVRRCASPRVPSFLQGHGFGIYIP